MKRLRKWVALFLLIFSTGFSLWLYRNEPTTKIDPNDNAFQYALIDRTNTMWDYAKTTCPKTLTYPICHVALLIDHWVPNWASGYNLPYYYSHIPQIMIVGSYRLFQYIHMLPTSVTLFQYYHIGIYLLLSCIPLAMFMAFRILSLSWLTAGLSAVFALLISTDGLYGIDQASFLWRGWGLSSQLFALLWFPLAVASAIQYTHTEEHKKRNLILTIGFLTATTMGHLGIGMMAWMAMAVIAFSPTIFAFFDKTSAKELIRQAMSGIKHTLMLILPTFVLLSYWIIPVFTGNAYHNTSVWDPVWKFNSFGVVEVMTKLANGELFDFGRLPVMTVLIIVGAYATWIAKKDTEKQLQPLGVLFIFFLCMLFGRTTWGGLIDLIPGMSEFHGHRFIVGLHLAGLFLAPLGVMWMSEKMTSALMKKIQTKKQDLLLLGSYLMITTVSCFLLIPQIVAYAKYNDTLLTEANIAYVEAKTDADLLLTTLHTLQTTNPGRVYALRGTEGNNFRIASSPYYMQLSTFGIPTVLWLPETWSPNSDTEQFFTEENPVHYNLYNIKYVVAPPDKTPQSFWKPLHTSKHWVLYVVDTNGYIDRGYAPSIVSSEKTDFTNLVHLWIQSDAPQNALFPELRITNKLKGSLSVPHFQMTDANMYQTPDKKFHALFEEPPRYTDTTQPVQPPTINILSQSTSQDMQFTATIQLTSPCPTCIILLKQTYHPNWQATVNGQPAQIIEVFPSYIAIRMEHTGMYAVNFTYRPSSNKLLLACIGLLFAVIGSILLLRKKT